MKTTASQRNHVQHKHIRGELSHTHTHTHIGPVSRVCETRGGQTRVTRGDWTANPDLLIRINVLVGGGIENLCPLTFN